MDKFEVVKYMKTSNFFKALMPSKYIYNCVVNDLGVKLILNKEEMNNLELIRALMLKCDGTTFMQAILN